MGQVVGQNDVARGAVDLQHSHKTLILVVDPRNKIFNAAIEITHITIILFISSFIRKPHGPADKLLRPQVLSLIVQEMEVVMFQFSGDAGVIDDVLEFLWRKTVEIVVAWNAINWDYWIKIIPDFTNIAYKLVYEPECPDIPCNTDDVGIWTIGNLTPKRIPQASPMV